MGATAHIGQGGMPSSVFTSRTSRALYRDCCLRRADDRLSYRLSSTSLACRSCARRHGAGCQSLRHANQPRNLFHEPEKRFLKDGARFCSFEITTALDEHELLSNVDCRAQCATFSGTAPPRLLPHRANLRCFCEPRVARDRLSRPTGRQPPTHTCRPAQKPTEATHSAKPQRRRLPWGSFLWRTAPPHLKALRCCWIAAVARSGGNPLLRTRRFPPPWSVQETQSEINNNSICRRGISLRQSPGGRPK